MQRVSLRLWVGQGGLYCSGLRTLSICTGSSEALLWPLLTRPHPLPGCHVPELRGPLRTPGAGLASTTPVCLWRPLSWLSEAAEQSHMLHRQPRPVHSHTQTNTRFDSLIPETQAQEDTGTPRPRPPPPALPDTTDAETRHPAHGHTEMGVTVSKQNLLGSPHRTESCFR